MPIRPSRITSLQNPRFRQAIRLRQRRGRKGQGRILIDGQREIRAALAAGLRLHEVFLREDQFESANLRDFSAGVPDWFVLPAALLAKVSYGGRDDQWVAVADPPRRSLAELELSKRALVAVLERVEKPGNLGAVVRTADAAGLDAVLIADEKTDLFNPNAIRASRGTLFTLPVCAANPTEIIAWLKRHALHVYTARLDGAQRYDTCDFRAPTAFVLGSEAEGLSAAWLQDPDFRGIHLPMKGHADSLNVSATAAVLFYEAERQRRQAQQACDEPPTRQA